LTIFAICHVAEHPHFIIVVTSRFAIVHCLAATLASHLPIARFDIYAIRHLPPPTTAHSDFTSF